MVSYSFRSRPGLKPELLKPRVGLEFLTGEEAEIVENTFLTRITRWHNDRILVFDETGRDPDTRLRYSNLQKISDPEPIYGRTLSTVVRYLETAGIAKENSEQN